MSALTAAVVPVLFISILVRATPSPLPVLSAGFISLSWLSERDF